MLRLYQQLGLRFAGSIERPMAPSMFNLGVPKRAVQTGKFGERERAFEDMDVKKHNEELLEKLRKAELAKLEAEAATKKAEERARAAEAQINQAAPKIEQRAPFNPFTSGQQSGSVSMEEYLSFRKEVINRIRELEDDIHELKLMQYKIKQ